MYTHIALKTPVDTVPIVNLYIHPRNQPLSQAPTLLVDLKTANIAWVIGYGGDSVNENGDIGNDGLSVVLVAMMVVLAPPNPIWSPQPFVPILMRNTSTLALV